MVSAYPVFAIILLRVTPSAKRNSYRVAKGAHHPRWATYIIVIPLQYQRMEDDKHGDTPNRPTPPYYIYRAHLSAHIWAQKSPRPSWCCTLHKQLFFYRREPDFFYGRRPLFEPWGMLSSCGA